MAPPDDPLEALRADPARTAVMVDFDGTLAPIVPAAADARPLPGVAETLLALRERFGVVAVVSGRPVAYLLEHLPAELHLVGLYGLEWTDGGGRHEHPEAAAWRPVVAAAAADARAALPEGVDVEHKGLSLTLHVRQEREASAEVAAWAAEAAARTGLHERAAKWSVELHPPIPVDKGTVVRELTGGCTAACYLGDDVGDLPAFAALDGLALAGGRAVRVGVLDAEASPELIAVADLTVEGPLGALAFLRALL